MNKTNNKSIGFFERYLSIWVLLCMVVGVFMLKAKAQAEIEWINKVDEISKGNFAIVKWTSKEIKGRLLKLL